MDLAADAAAYIAKRRRKPAQAEGRPFRTEYRAIPLKPRHAPRIRSSQRSAPAAPPLSPLVADLARILADPRAFPRALI